MIEVSTGMDWPYQLRAEDLCNCGRVLTRARKPRAERPTSRSAVGCMSGSWGRHAQDVAKGLQAGCGLASGRTVWY